MLVNELVHVYNGFGRREEVYDMSGVVGLSAEEIFGECAVFRVLRCW